MSSAPSPRESRKRSLSPNHDNHYPNRREGRRLDRDRDDELPWWEQDRNASSSRRPPTQSSRNNNRDTCGAGSNRRDSDRDWDRDGAHESRHPGGGHRGAGRGARGGGGSFRGSVAGGYRGGGGRGGREHFDDTRSRNSRSPYSQQATPEQQSFDRRPPPPPVSRPDDVEEGEIALNYSESRPIEQKTALTREQVPVEIEVDAPEEPDPEQVLAERRRKRAEILAKYSAGTSVTRSITPAFSEAGDSTPQNGSSLPTPAPGIPLDQPSTPGRKEVETRTTRLRLGTDSPVEPEVNHEDTTDDAFDLFKDEASNEAIRIVDEEEGANGEHDPQVSAADYNPDEDRKEDDRRRAERDGPNHDANTIGKKVHVVAAVEDEDDDDMFSLGLKPVEADDGSFKPAFVPVINRSLDEASGLTDNFDDAEGYYKLILGETLDNGRYHVHANLGKGMFSGVVRAKDLTSLSGAEVAIKVIRSQESMYKAGMKEANILRKLMEADPTDKKHIIRLERTFEHRGHLCLVFESLSMNLREVVKRFGKDVGINLRAVRAYASQMFLGLSLMRKCEIMHADIKPDNILVNESKSVLKICDLGSASDISENDITPYLVSRFYRAPEIILGLPYDCSLDTWSIGCTLYELYTGKILFPGRTNNHMLLLIMELKGKMSHKMLKRAKFVDQHFDESMNFLSLEKNDTVKTVALPAKAVHDLRSRLMPVSAMKKLKDDEIKLLGNFVDLLDKMLNLDPSKRPTPKELLAHPFLRN